MTKIGEHVWI